MPTTGARVRMRMMLLSFGLVLGVTSAALSAPLAQAFDPDLTAPLNTGLAHVSVEGATGTTIVVKNYDSDTVLASTNGGDWDPVDAPSADAVSGGNVYYTEGSDLWAVPVDGSDAQSVSLNDEVGLTSGADIVAASGPYVAINGYAGDLGDDVAVGVDTSSGTALVFDAAVAYALQGVDASGALFATQDWTGTDPFTTLTLQSWSGTTRTLDVPDNVYTVRIIGDEARYSYSDGTQRLVCRLDLAAWTQTCRDGLTGPSTRVAGTPDSPVIVDGSAEYIDVAGNLVAVDMAPAGALTPPAPIVSDTARPLVTAGAFSFWVNPDGSLEQAADVLYGEPDGVVLALTTGSLVTADARDVVPGTNSVWRRSVGSEIGADETTLGRSTKQALSLAAPGQALASGARSLIYTWTGSQWTWRLFDGTTQTADLGDGSSAGVSGPYVRVESTVYRPDGAPLAGVNAAGSVQFGSRMAKLNAAGTQVVVTDLSGATPDKAATLPPVSFDYALVDLYGDRVLASYRDDSDTEHLVVVDVSTNESRTPPAAHDYVNTANCEIGDGWVGCDGLIWFLADDSVLEDPTDAQADFVMDGDRRIAFVDRFTGEYVVRDFDGIGLSAGRVLGAVAPGAYDQTAGGTWPIEIDVSKGINAGEIVIRNSDNEVVATLSTPASANGAVRTAWDGSVVDGITLYTGTYTWEFVADADDDTGAVKAVDGTSKVAGSVDVTGVPLPVPRFIDVPFDSKFSMEIEWLAAENVTTGWPDGTYRPLEPIARNAMAAFIYRLAGSPEFTPPTTATFKDVPVGSKFSKEIEWLAAEGVTTGYPDGTYRPLSPIAREAMAAFLYRLENSPAYTPPATASFTDVAAGSKFYKEVEWMAETGITTGWEDGTFRPTTPVARNSMAAFLYRYVQEFGKPTP